MADEVLDIVIDRKCDLILNMQSNLSRQIADEVLDDGIACKWPYALGDTEDIYHVRWLTSDSGGIGCK